ncbi:MAG TPA: DoxX family membrane protein [Fimbriimonadaceae bacterium]|jgi:uncharacterized membrane protein YphA (DoxX/SURF4 family)
MDLDSLITDNGLTIAQTVACLFFAILFLQSGLDKVFDFKGNREYIDGHFASSPFKSFSSILLIVMTILEISAGLASAVGTYFVLTHGSYLIPVAAMMLVCISLLCLFLGQRIAKDYAGASTLAVYFAVALLATLLMSAGHQTRFK